MSISIEKQARRALRRVVFYRVLGDIMSLPQFIMRACVSLLSGIAGFFHRMEITIFCLEQDAARRYQLLTNLDLGMATSEPGRYASLDPVFAEQARESFQRSILEGGDEE